MRWKIAIAVLVVVIGILALFRVDSNLSMSESVDRVKAFFGGGRPHKNGSGQSRRAGVGRSTQRILLLCMPTIRIFRSWSQAA